MFLIAGFTLQSCTVTKRVHRKGWHISWNKNYKSSGTSKTENITPGSDIAQKQSPKSATASETLHKVVPPSTSTHSEFSATSDAEVPIEEHHTEKSKTSRSSQTVDDELPAESRNEQIEIKRAPLGGPFVFLAIFTGLSAILLFFSGFEFAIGSLLIVAAAIAIIIHITTLKTGSNKKSHLRPGSFYNSILFLILTFVSLAYLVIYGGLSSAVGFIIFAVFILLMALLLFLIFQTKDLKYEDIEREKALKEKEQKSSTANQRKQRIAGIILAGFVIALFGTIAFLN